MSEANELCERSEANTPWTSRSNCFFRILIALWLQINAFSLIIFIAASTIWASYALRSPIYFYNLIMQIKIQWVSEANALCERNDANTPSSTINIFCFIDATWLMIFHRKNYFLFHKWYYLNAFILLLPDKLSSFNKDTLCRSFDPAQIILLNRSFLNDLALLSSSINPSLMIQLYWSC